MKPMILVVDDDKNTRDGLQRALQRSYTVKVAENADAALAVLAREPEVALMLSDLRMPGVDGLGLLQQVKKLYPELLCVLLTAYGSVETAVDAMKQGAADFLTKPVNLDHLDLLVSRILKTRELERKIETLQTQLNEKYGMENIIGESPRMRSVFEVIQQTAPTQATVLIQGPSGTGKEMVAQAIHRLSTRAKGPFIAVHCAALSSTVLESELFGHERGAFTGATAQRKGRFEMADGGTLFLDEISEIEPALQVKLLRVLEERAFERVGGEETVHVDIRVIAATNRNLREYVKEGRFREDLYFRLNVVDILLPALHERTGDIPLLVERFLREYCEKNGKKVTRVSPDVMRMLAAYAWPGNVRELRNTMERMVVLAKNEELMVGDVPETIRMAVAESGMAESNPVLVTGSLAETEKQKIMAVLKKNGDNRTRAAEELGISRRTLHRKLKEYGETGRDEP